MEKEQIYIQFIEEMGLEGTFHEFLVEFFKTNTPMEVHNGQNK